MAGIRATAARSFAARPASGAAEVPQGKRQSAHSVLACRPWSSSFGRVPLEVRGGGEEAFELLPVAAARRVQRRGHVPVLAVRRVGDAVERQRVEQLRPEVVAAHDGREVGHAAGAADGVEHAPHRRELRDAEVGLPHLRHDRVEHELRDVGRMGQPVALADVRAVRDAVERPLVDAERLAQVLHVGDRVVGAEELTPRVRPCGRRNGRRRRWAA